MSETLREAEKHIKQNHEDRKTLSWCGESLTPTDWTFQSIDHAVLSIESGNRLYPCRKCVKKIQEILAENAE